MAKVWNWTASGAAAGVAMLLLSACDNGPSAVARGERASEAAAARDDAGPSESPRRFADSGRSESHESDGVDHRAEPAMKLDGEAAWAATKRYSAEESARRGFERNGKDFGAADVEAYVAKAHNFVTNPPSGAESLKRPNGDTLYYDAKTNVFAVANKDGLPKTMFKPDDGPKYWTEQKDRDSHRQTARRGGGGGDEG
jgi:pyocin large subunit-like protein